MASVHKRPASQYYHAAFRGPDGRLMLRSTKQTNHSAALAVALEYERAAKLAKRGDLTEGQARGVLNDIMARADIGETVRCLSISAFLHQWQSSKEARRKATTAQRYDTVVKFFLEYIGKRAEKPVTALQAADIDGFMNARLKQGLAPRTVVLDIKILRSALNVARRQGLISTNVAEAVELPEAKGVERGTFNPVEVATLVREADGEWKTMILLAYFTGARLADCCAAKWDSVDLAQQTFSHVQGKTGQRVVVPLHPDLSAHLEKLASTDSPQTFIMPAMANLKPGGRHGLSEGFKRIVRKGGLDLQTVAGGGKRHISRRTFHALRHSFTSAMVNAGIRPEVRMALTGHKSEAVHQGYTHHELEPLRQAVGSIPRLPVIA